MRLSASLLGFGVLALATSIASADPPNGPPPGGMRRGPPQAAFDACANLSQGAACTVQVPDRTLQGTCETFPDRGLACRPAGMGGPPPQR
ncbi:MAG: hypothetical protein JWM10_2161 [Myxococcaceae bacterium]|nr:hypothetical protein [Myxococcaceae bacterium]